MKKGKKKIKQSQAMPSQIGRGLDVGTTFIYSAQKMGSEVKFNTERNAFFDIERNDFVENILKKSNVKCALKGDKLCVIGENALKFANVFGKETRRSLKSGVISPQEEDALPILNLIIENTLGPHRHKGETIFYSVPGAPVDADFNVIYHEQILRRMLQNLGYEPKSINEGLAVIYSELANNDFTGMGISFGGGMANVCLAVMSIPVFSFSIAKAGDWIDAEVARVSNETGSKITAIKESRLDLTKPENSLTKIEQALSIYYNHLIEYVLSCVKNEIEKQNKMPLLESPISIVISGGTAKPKGFLERFKTALNKTNLPLKIGEVKLASHPLHTVAKGALIAAIADKGK
ncbi:MAG: hypothetical protein WBC21_01260 [Minisyncoccales bacterium]